MKNLYNAAADGSSQIIAQESRKISFLHRYVENFWIPAVVTNDVVVAR